jgi:hypothetical protein
MLVQALSTATPSPAPRGIPFTEVQGEVATRAALAYPDQVLPLARLRATETGTLDVPGVGMLMLTDWSRKQLARMLGIRWDRWFAEELVSPTERADEINRRLNRHPGEMKIRSRRFEPGEAGAGDGVLRAFLGAGYTSIDDGRIFDRMARVLGSRAEEYRFVRATVSDETSQYAAVTARETDLGRGRPDPHRDGFMLANSEVGARAVSLHVFIHRLVCTNGLVVSDARLFYRVHRRSDDDVIERDLAYALSLLPERGRAGLDALRASRSVSLPDPEQALRDLIGDEPDVRRHLDIVLAVFREEPEPTRFGLAQAITRVAQRLRPEDRLTMELFAGRLVAAPRGEPS